MFGKYTIVSLDRAEKISTLTEKKKMMKEKAIAIIKRIYRMFLFLIGRQ